MINKPLCVILDDEEIALDSLKEKIEEIDLLEIERAFLDPNNLLDELDKLQSHIYFLDIEMAISGIDVAKKLRHKAIIFVSGHNEYISDVVDITPVAFVQKPIRIHKLREAIKKAIGTIKSELPDFIVIKTQSAKKTEIKHKDIIYIKSNSRNKEIFLANNKKSIIAKYVNFEELFSQLSNDFIQINPSNIINLKYATKLIDADTIGISYQGKIVEVILGDKYKERFFSEKPHLRD